MDTWETRRGVQFIDLVPHQLRRLADAAEKNNKLQEERNELLRRQTEALEKIAGDNSALCHETGHKT